MSRFIHLILILLLSLQVQSQLRIRVMQYNLLSFGPPCTNVNISNKYNWLGTILEHYQPHIFTVNELGPNIAYANGIKALSFDYTNRISYADFTNNANSNFVNQLFYDHDIFAYTGVEVIGGFLRDMNVYHLYIKPTTVTPGVDTVFLDCIVAHYKAGDTPGDANTRAGMAQAVMNYISTKGKGKNILVMGDFNLYSHNEAAFQTMVFNPDTSIRLLDPAGKQNGWNGSTHAIIHTQSPRQSSVDCGSGGGMDDRFDFILASPAIMGDTAGIGYVPGTYAALGNDGNSYNQELLCSNTGSVPAAICAAMKQMSDHLPVVMQLEVAGVTGIEDHQLADFSFSVTPQKNDNIIRVYFSDDLSKPQTREISLTNLFGQTLFTQTISPGVSQIAIPATSLASGLYVIRLKNSQNQSVVRKLLW
ncbi:MAG: T9SS type A sorting domain-containing protein [Bacteroidia bacterium]